MISLQISWMFLKEQKSASLLLPQETTSSMFGSGEVYSPPTLLILLRVMGDIAL